MNTNTYLGGYRPYPSMLPLTYIEQTRKVAIPARNKAFNFYVELLHLQLLRKYNADGALRTGPTEVYHGTPFGDIYTREGADIKSPSKNPYNKHSNEDLGLNQYFAGQNPKQYYIGDPKDGIYHDICDIRHISTPFYGAFSLAMQYKASPSGLQVLRRKPSKKENISSYAMITNATPLNKTILVAEKVIENGQVVETGKQVSVPIPDAYTLHFDIYRNFQKVGTETMEVVKKQHTIMIQIDYEDGEPTLKFETVKTDSYRWDTIMGGFMHAVEDYDNDSDHPKVILKTIIDSKPYEMASSYESDGRGGLKPILAENYHTIVAPGWFSNRDYLSGELQWSFNASSPVYIGLNNGVIYKYKRLGFGGVAATDPEPFKHGDCVAHPTYYLKNHHPTMPKWDYVMDYLKYYRLHIEEDKGIPDWLTPVVAIISIVLIVWGGYAIAAAYSAAVAGTATTSATLAGIGSGLGAIGIGITLAGFATGSGELMKIGKIVGLAGAVLAIAGGVMSFITTSGEQSLTPAINESIRSNIQATGVEGLKMSVAEATRLGAEVSAGNILELSAEQIAGIVSTPETISAYITGAEQGFAAADSFIGRGLMYFGADASSAGQLTTQINQALSIGKSVLKTYDAINGAFNKTGQKTDPEIPQGDETDKRANYFKSQNNEYITRRYYNSEPADLGLEPGTLMYNESLLWREE